MNFKFRQRHVKNSMARKLITVMDTKHIVSEQFRTIRTNILFAMPEDDVKTILVTSSIPGEGKSTSAANLAVVFTQEGKRVCIIDADLRRPTLHYTFRIANTVGLSSILSRQYNLQEAIQELPIYQLFIIPSGPPPPNPAELLSSNMMDALLQELKQQFDVIIIDAPPILSVTDAQILANKCDGTLIIASTGIVQKAELTRAKMNLQAAQAKILGVVLNNYPLSKKQDAYHQYFNI